MKKVLMVSLFGFVLGACSDDKKDDVLEFLEDQKKEHQLEDERARKAMDMTGGAKVYELPKIDFSGKKSDDKEKNKE